MRVFVTGANGFIGGAVASALIADGHKVRGLVRNKVKADTVAPQGIEPVVGSLDDAALLQTEARAADAVVNAASSDHRGAVGPVFQECTDAPPTTWTGSRAGQKQPSFRSSSLRISSLSST